MDLGDEELPPPAGDADSAGLPLQLSDVIEVLRASDPGIIQESSSVQAHCDVEAQAVSAPSCDMYGGGGAGSRRGGGGGGGGGVPLKYIQITEQPAPRAVRFRYECEGRSAGSIPGESSTQENKTYPSVRLHGISGRAVVVVSCVTSDEPYRPHPHKLVGRDVCIDGVCTVQVTPDNPVVSFTNLGIQCVKKRDIDQALREREYQRVDPYKTGFEHRRTPQSIDLNSVRLCFQAFEEKNREFNRRLDPVVSNVIYDKKSNNELTIARMSHCSASVAGGQDVILLCEKVTKDDIVVVMREQQPSEGEPWEVTIDSVHVHRQVAVVFKTPTYKSLHVDRGVKVNIQLKRKSNGEMSEPREFELTPMTGNVARKRTADLLADILATERDTNNNRAALAAPDSTSDSQEGDSCSVNVDSTPSGSVSNGNIGEDLRESAASDPSTEPMDAPPAENSLDYLLDQVAELDEIYTENRTRLEKVERQTSGIDIDEDFDDAGTYTSLQLAFKNPVEITEPDSYEDVITCQGPIVDFAPSMDDRTPPLPPKRIRKAPSVKSLKVDRQSVENLLKPGKMVPLSRSRPDLSVSEPALPPAPRKKRSFLSRLFRRRRNTPPTYSEGETRKSRPVGRSVSSVSGQRPSKFKVDVSHASLKDDASGLSYADSVTHISLHEDAVPADGLHARSLSTRSLRTPNGPAPPMGDDTILVAETVLALSASDFKKLQDDLDLTEAEHYALYMAVAPRATASEFDETSCYYSPVDTTKFLHNQQ